MKKEQITINFGLKSVDTTEFSFDVRNMNLGNKDISFQIHTYYEANNTSKCMIIMPTIKTFEGDAEDKAIFSLTVRYVFQVENFDEFLHEDEGVLKVSFPLDFISNILSVAISTTRGILIGKLSGTPLRNFILPIQNPKDIIQPIADTLANFPVD